MSVASTQTAPPRVGLRWSLALLACVAAAMVYLNTLHNPFVYDDHRLIVENESLSLLPNLYAIAVHEVTRPLVNLTYALDWSVWGLDPFGFHTTNVLLHVVNVALVFLLAGRLTVDAATRNEADVVPAPNLVAAATALIFGLNPMMTQAVGYISGRSELLCGTFVLLMFLAARQFILASRRMWAVAAVGAWLFALLSKEVAAVMPIVLVLYDWSLGTPVAGFRSRLLRLYAPMVAFMLIAIAGRVWVLQYVEYPSQGFNPTFVLVQLEAIRRYAFLLLGQGPQSIFHQLTPYDSWASARALATLATIPLATLVIGMLHRLHRLAAFGALWFLLCLLPSSALFVLGRGEAMAEHRVYIAAIGFFLSAGALVECLARLFAPRPAFTRWCAAGVACMAVAQLAMHTVLRNVVWSDPVGLWQDAVNRAPRHWLPHLMLGEAFREAGRCVDAVGEYRVAVAANPDEPLAYSHLGSCLIATNQVDDASRVFSALDTRHPDSAEAAAGLGLVALAEDRLGDARNLLLESVRRDGGSVPVRQLLVALDGQHEATGMTEFCATILAVAPFSRTALACAPPAQKGAR